MSSALRPFDLRLQETPFQDLPVGDWLSLRESVRLWNPDLIVTVARKTPRIDGALHLDFRQLATTVSDLALPFCQAFIRGARVAIIDDTINVGSTLRHAQALCRRLDAREVHLFSVNARQQRSPLGEDVTLANPQPLSDKQCEAVAHHVPAAIALLSKPYDLDFPVIPCDVLAPYSNFDDLLALFKQLYGNRVFDLTTARGRTQGLFRLTIDWPMLGAHGKIRIYYDETAGICNLVPIRLRTPLATEFEALPPLAWVRSIWEELDASLDPDEETRGEARARLFLFLDSLCMGRAALRPLRAFLQPRSAIDLRDAELIFGPSARRMLIPSLADDVDEADALADVPRDPYAVPVSPFYANVCGPDFRHELVQRSDSADPISLLVAFFELLAEKAGALDINGYALTWPHSRSEITQHPYRRLRIGATYGDLVRILMDTAQGTRSVSDWGRCVSKLLDHLIDLGVVVPTVGKYEGRYYRIFRKGEAPPSETTVKRILMGMDDYRKRYHKSMSRTRITKVGVILHFASSADAFARVSAGPRGYLLCLEGDVLDGSPEVTQYMLRTRAIVRAKSSQG